MNNGIINEYTKTDQLISKEGLKDMHRYYCYQGVIKDTKENWLGLIDEIQFYGMLAWGDLCIA